MDAFLVNPTYRIENEKAYVYLYGRQADGRTFLTRNRAKAYFHIREIDAAQAQALIPQLSCTSSTLKDFREQALATIQLDNPKDVPTIRDMLHDAGIPTYEADVRFVQRFLLDHNIKGSLRIDGTAQPHAFVDAFYDEPSIGPSTYVPTNLKTLAIDIETGPKAQSLYCISLVGTDGYSRVLFVSDTPVAGAEQYPSEKACLEAFAAALREYDPDIVTGWSVIDFDLRVLHSLCQKNHVPFILGRDDSPTRVKVESQFFRDSSAEILGRVVLDGIALLKINFVKLEDYKLDTAAVEILGEKKLIGKTNKLKEIEDAYRNNKALLAEYCKKDSELVLQILAKKQLIELMVQRSRLTGMPLDRVKASIASLDSLYLRALRTKGYAATTLVPQEKEQQLTGGYVMESKPGIYDYVIVCDFKSLYPSVIRTLNIDPLSYQPDLKIEKSSPEFVVAENGAVFRNEDGILPRILDELHNARETAKKAKNTVAINAIKIVMNSFWGSLGSPQSRYFSLAIGNGITFTCQHIIKHSAELIRAKGYDLIYGDTDSLFIDLKVDTVADAERQGREVVQLVNEHLTKYIKERYYRESKLEIQLDKVFVRFFMPMTRGGEGSKKRYAGLRIVDGKERIDFTGLEFVRRDWTELAKELQLGILDRIFHKKEVTSFVKEFVRELKAGKLDHLLVYKKALRKGIEGYTKTTPQHVKAARLMDSISSTLIEYYVTTQGPQPTEKRTAPIDYEHYIEKQIRPIADAVLVFYGTNFDDLLSGTSQRNLFSY